MKGLGRAAMPPPTVAHDEKKMNRELWRNELDDEMDNRAISDEMEINREERY